MKPEDKKTGFRFERKKHKHSLLASTVLLFGLKEGGCWEEVSVWAAGRSLCGLPVGSWLHFMEKAK